MGKIIRLFKCTAYEMLTALETIINVCITNNAEIVKERPLWTVQFFNDFLAVIQNAYIQFLGIDNAKELRAATKALFAIINPASDDISKFNTQVKNDFDNDKPKRDEILNTLGFKSYFKAVLNKTQDAIILLLLQFAKNISPQIEADLIAGGMSPELITRMKGYGNTLNAANVTQETAKKIRPDLTDAKVSGLNDIYKQGIKICKIVRGLFKGNKSKQDLFSFSKTIKAITNGTSIAANETAASTPQPAV